MTTVATAPTATQPIASCTLIYVEVDENSNKVWKGFLWPDNTFEAQWGRVGKKLQCKTYQFSSLYMAQLKFESMKRAKLRKGYTEAQVVTEANVAVSLSNRELKAIAAKQIHHGRDPRAKLLIQYLVEQNIHQILSQTQITYNSTTGTFSTPLGCVTPSAIAQARDYLWRIACARRKTTDTFRQLVSQYLRLIPQDMGHKLDAAVFHNKKEIRRQHDILDALDAAVEVTLPKDAKQDLFHCTINRVPGSTPDGRQTFRWIRKLYQSTLNPNHYAADYQLSRVYEVEIPSMAQAFEAKAEQLGNVKLHWHGTKAGNLLSILHKGLIIPPPSASHCTGRMFGNGIYGSVQSTKSLNYATNYWYDSGEDEQRIFMLLCDFALGKSYRPKTWSRSFPVPGYDSTVVEPGDANVMNQESIVYQVSQVSIRYLCEFV
ncbi:MAG: WGR domain-containing protein [Spirulina sp. SIO3F2]|nr:WGR domain-containing protein [Spirulina sp. SIO3F2]